MRHRGDLFARHGLDQHGARRQSAEAHLNTNWLRLLSERETEIIRASLQIEFAQQAERRRLQVPRIHELPADRETSRLAAIRSEESHSRILRRLPGRWCCEPGRLAVQRKPVPTTCGCTSPGLRDAVEIALATARRLCAGARRRGRLRSYPG